MPGEGSSGPQAIYSPIGCDDRERIGTLHDKRDAHEHLGDWNTRPEPQAVTPSPVVPVAKLSAQSRVVEPIKQAQSLAEVAAQRKIAA